MVFGISRTRGGYRQTRMRDLLPGAKAEPKVGRGRRTKEQTAALNAIIIPWLVDRLAEAPRTLRQLLIASDFYESDLKACLKLIHARYGKVAGYGKPVYTLGD